MLFCMVIPENCSINQDCGTSANAEKTTIVSDDASSLVDM